MLELIKRTHLTECRSFSKDRLLREPLQILRGVTSRQAKKWATQHQLSTIGELLAAWPAPQAWGVAFSDETIELLMTHLLYPQYDPGPPATWERLFMNLPLDFFVNHPKQRFRTAFGPIMYRGRLDGSARVLIVAQDPSTDETIAHRTLVGDAGQRLQRLLQKLGLTRSYLMLNTFPFGITGQFDAEMKAISLDPTLLNYRNSLFDKAASENPFEAILAFGNGAQHCVAHWPNSKNLPILELHHPSAPDEIRVPNWNLQLPLAAGLIAPDPGMTPDLTPFELVSTEQDYAVIPRQDLPFGIPGWHGSQGTRSKRNGPKEILWSAV